MKEKFGKLFGKDPIFEFYSSLNPDYLGILWVYGEAMHGERELLKRRKEGQALMITSGELENAFELKSVREFFLTIFGLNPKIKVKILVSKPDPKFDQKINVITKGYESCFEITP